jgi:DHA1 family multidrug resistance protein-like MFS transporter
MIGAVGRGIAYIVIYIAFFVESYPLIVMGTFSIGFLVGFFWVPFDALIAQKTHKDYRATAFGKRSYWLGISIFLGSSVGLTYTGFLTSFTSSALILFLPLIIYAISNVIGAILLYRVIDEKLVIASAVSSENEKSNRLPPNILFGFAFLFFVLLLSSTNGSISGPYVIPFLQETFGIVNFQTGLAWVPAGILNLILAPYLGKLVDKMKPKIAILLTAFLGSFLTWALIYWGSQNIILFAIILIPDMAIATTAGLTVQNYLSRIKKSGRGKIFGLSSFFSNLGAVIGPLLGGLAWDIGIVFPFIISIAVELCLIPFYWFAVTATQDSLEERYLESHSSA